MQKEKPCRTETLQNVKSLEDLTSHKTRTAEGFVIFSFGKIMTSHENKE